MNANPYDQIRAFLGTHEKGVLSAMEPVINAVPEEVREIVRNEALRTGAKLAFEALYKASHEEASTGG